MLVGNPNAGKSTLFNRLTHGHAKVGNWHGVTVGALEGRAGAHTIVDLPGIYSLDGASMEERLAVKEIETRQGVLLFVSECENVARMLPLMAALTREGRSAVLVLTKRKPFERRGGRVDERGLAKRVGLPVYYAESVPDALETIAAAPPVRVADVPLTGVYTPVSADFSRADKLLLNGFFGIPFFFALMLGAFFVTFARGMPGDLMKEGIERFFGETLGGEAEKIASPVLRSFLKDGVLGSLGSVLCFLPQIMLLTLFLILMEESGLLSRLAVLTDPFFSAIGLNGRAVFSILMGFGCTAAAILTTRGLDDKRVQRRVILCLPYISCSAKLPVYLALSASLFQNPFAAVALLYALGVGISVAVALLLKGETRPLVLELAPLQVPSAVFVLKSLLFQLKQFIIKVATVILAFFLFSWILSSFDSSFRLCAAEDSMLAAICGGLRFLFAPIGMGDWRIAYAALSGLVAKENIAAAIAMLYGTFPYGAASAFSFAVFVLACSPCVSAIAATARAVGTGRAVLYAAVQTATALCLSYLVYFCLRGGAIVVLLALPPVLGSVLLGKNIEKIHRNRADNAQKIHRRHRRAGVVRLPHPAQKQGDQGQRQKDGVRSSLAHGR